MPTCTLSFDFHRCECTCLPSKQLAGSDSAPSGAPVPRARQPCVIPSASSYTKPAVFRAHQLLKSARRPSRSSAAIAITQGRSGSSTKLAGHKGATEMSNASLPAAATTRPPASQTALMASRRIRDGNKAYPEVRTGTPRRRESSSHTLWACTHLSTLAAAAVASNPSNSHLPSCGSG